MKKFDEWNKVKKNIHKSKSKIFFKERDIFYIKMGENIGFEQSGKGDIFLRPAIVLKKFNNSFFMGVPLTSTIKDGKYYFTFEFKGKNSNAILSQIRPFDTKRIKHKIGMINKDYFKKLKEKIGKLYQYELAPLKNGDDPEGICSASI